MPIEGYDYIETTIDNDGNTIHTYKKAFKKPVTKFIDENGLEISDPEDGRNPSKAIQGYEIIETKTDDKGNIIYVYRKKATESKPVTKFVDEKGNPIADEEKGNKDKKEIPGYEFVKTETDKDGNTVHIYKKKSISPGPGGYPSPNPKSSTKFVDENGKEIEKTELGKNPKKDIDGYEYVKTETDKDGNTVHIYKKSSAVNPSTSDDKFKVKHNFESSTPGKTLPKEVLDLLPKDELGKENGEVVSPSKPSKLKVEVEGGTWIFEGYDKNISKIDNKDANFTGKWKFIAKSKDTRNVESEKQNPDKKNSAETNKKHENNPNVKTGIADSSNVILVLIGSAFALYTSRKNKY